MRHRTNMNISTDYKQIGNNKKVVRTFGFTFPRISTLSASRVYRFPSASRLISTASAPLYSYTGAINGAVIYRVYACTVSRRGHIALPRIVCSRAWQ